MMKCLWRNPTSWASSPARAMDAVGCKGMWLSYHDNFHVMQQGYRLCICYASGVVPVAIPAAVPNGCYAKDGGLSMDAVAVILRLEMISIPKITIARIPIPMPMGCCKVIKGPG